MPAASRRGAVPSVMIHITGIQSASSQPETSAHRPDTRNPPSTTTARPDGRVELAKSRRGSLNSAVRTASEAYRLARHTYWLFQAIHATDASAYASSSYTWRATTGSASSPPRSRGKANRHNPASMRPATTGGARQRAGYPLKVGKLGVG